MAVRTYRLTVDGELTERAVQAFDGMTLTREDGRTVLTGLVRDQAELQGHLQRVSDLGLTLLGATPVADEAQSTTRNDASANAAVREQAKPNNSRAFRRARDGAAHDYWIGGTDGHR